MERLTAVRPLIDKLESLGLSKEVDGVAVFMAEAREYVRLGESRSGSIPLIGMTRRIDYVLSVRRHVACTVNLRHDPTV